jgi:hypothetical protein
MPATEPTQPHARTRRRRLALVIVPALAALLLAAVPASADTEIFTNSAPIAVASSTAVAWSVDRRARGSLEPVAAEGLEGVQHDDG